MVFRFLAIEREPQVPAFVFGERRRCRRHERDALVGRPEQHVERHARGSRRMRIKATERGDGATGIEQTGIEEIGTRTTGFKCELTEAQYAEFETELDEVGWMHGGVLYTAQPCASSLSMPTAYARLRARVSSNGCRSRTRTSSVCRRPRRSASSWAIRCSAPRATIVITT